MKTLILAILAFALVLWGTAPVRPFRRTLKRVHRAVRQPSLSRATVAPPLEPARSMRRRRS